MNCRQQRIHGYLLGSLCLAGIRIRAHFHAIAWLTFIIMMGGCGSGGGGGDAIFNGGDPQIDVNDTVYVITNDGPNGEIAALDAFRLDDRNMPSPNGTDDDPADLAMDEELGLLFVANSGDDTVTVYDAETLDVVRVILTGDRPVALTINQDEHFLYVACQGDDLLEKYEADTGAFLDDEATGAAPVDVLWYDFLNVVVVACRDSNQVRVHADDTLHILRQTDTNANGGAAPMGLALDGGAGILFVACRDTDNVLLYDTATLGFLNALPVGDQPEYVLADAALNRLFVTNSGANTVSAFALNTWLELPQSPMSTQGQRPGALAVHVPGQLLYIVNRDSNNLTVLRTADLNEYGPSPYPVGDAPMAALVPREP